MNKYKINQQVDVTIERVLPFGVFVRLPNGTSGYIRRRELDLDADVEPSEIVQDGQKIQAMVIKTEEADARIELSRRAVLTDPWPEFFKQFSVGDVVRGTVRALHPHGAFIRLQPGIGGFVGLEELAPKTVAKPEDVIWAGDEIEAVITRIWAKKRQISLSIKARLYQYDLALEAAKSISSNDAPSATNKKKMPLSPRGDKVDFSKIGPILIVEDDEGVRESLKSWFTRREIHAVTAASTHDAMDLLGTPFRIFLIDMSLEDDDGLELVRHIRQNGHPGYVCVMSSPDVLAERADEIQVARVIQAFDKPLDMGEMERFLLRVARNEPLAIWQARPSENTHRSIAEALHAFGLLPNSHIQSVLKELTEMTQAQVGLLFWLDPASQIITVQSQWGEGKLNSDALYGLRESPVKDVIVNGEPIFENDVHANARAKFEKLFELIPFKSCIGIPVTVFGETRHALFFLHGEKDAFSKYRLRDARAGALAIATLLTDQHLRQQLRSINPMLLSGELAASFGHDVFNKITALELEASNLVDMGDKDGKRAKRILALTEDLKGTVTAFQQILRRKEQTESIQIPEIVNNAIRLLRAMLQKEKVNVVLKIPADLPLVMGNAVFVQQVFLNLMLNAVQQMALKAEKYAWDGSRTLEVNVTLHDAWLQIRFKDNGPGIHKEHLGKLFTPGFSTRGGSGLGLCIALSFIQAMGGRLSVEESLAILGSVFLVELPLKEEKMK